VVVVAGDTTESEGRCIGGLGAEETDVVLENKRASSSAPAVEAVVDATFVEAVVEDFCGWIVAPPAVSSESGMWSWDVKGGARGPPVAVEEEYSPLPTSISHDGSTAVTVVKYSFVAKYS